MWGGLQCWGGDAVWGAAVWRGGFSVWRGGCSLEGGGAAVGEGAAVYVWWGCRVGGGLQWGGAAVSPCPPAVTAVCSSAPCSGPSSPNSSHCAIAENGFTGSVPNIHAEVCARVCSGGGAVSVCMARASMRGSVRVLRARSVGARMFLAFIHAVRTRWLGACVCSGCMRAVSVWRAQCTHDKCLCMHLACIG